MNSKIVLVIVVSILTQTLNAQNKAKGILTDKQTNALLSFASIAILSLPDSAIVKGTVSDQTGKFLFDNLNAGTYCLKVKYMGYQDLTSSNINLDGKNGTYEFENLAMEMESKTLSDVDVTAERLKGVETVDRTVYTIPDAAKKTAGSGTDIIKRIPAVQVDLSNNISLEGSSNIIILVDGKERDNNFVAQIDPKLIDKIEVSTNPSSKYDASITGVISIVLKRQKSVGINGNFDIEIPTSTDHYIGSSTAGIDYGYNKLRVFVSMNDHMEGFPLTKDFYREGFNSKYIASGTGRFSYNEPVFHYGFDYFINEFNTVNFYANFKPTVNENNYLFNKYNYNADTLTSYFTTDTKTRDERNGQFYSLFYKKTFDKSDRNLTSDISFYTNHGKTMNKYFDQYYNNDGVTKVGEPIFRNDILEPMRKSTNTKIDYTQSFYEKLKLETGFQNYNQWIDNSLNTTEINSNGFNYREIRYAAYLQLGLKIKKWNLRAGVRAENSDININNMVETGYSCWLPNSTIQYSLNKAQSFKLNYRKSIKRPGSDDLNPYTMVYDSLNIMIGNPDLKPSYTDKIQFNYSLNFGSNYFGPEIYFLKQSDIFQQVGKLNANNVMVLRTENLGEGYEYGIGLTSSLQIKKWLTLNPYFKIFREHYKGTKDQTEFEIPEVYNYSWQGTLYALAKLPKGFSLWGYTTYTKPGISLQNKNYRDCLYVIGLEKNLFKEKAKIGINWYEMFRDKFRFDRKVTQTPGLYKDDDNHVKLGTLVSVKLTYKFSYGSEVKKLDRQKNLESDGKGGLN